MIANTKEFMYGYSARKRGRRMKSKSRDTDDFLTEVGGWYASMVICRNCGHKWGAVYPDTTKPSELQCPKCGWFGADIAESEDKK